MVLKLGRETGFVHDNGWGGIIWPAMLKTLSFIYHAPCCPRCLVFGEGGQVPFGEEAMTARLVGCLRLPNLHFRKAEAPVSAATGGIPSFVQVGFGWTPTNPLLQ